MSCAIGSFKKSRRPERPQEHSPGLSGAMPWVRPAPSRCALQGRQSLRTRPGVGWLVRGDASERASFLRPFRAQLFVGRLPRASLRSALYSVSGVVHRLRRSLRNPSATQPVQQRRRDGRWKDSFLFANNWSTKVFGVGLRYEHQPCSLDEHSPTSRPEPQPERGYAYSGDDAQRPTLYGLRPAFTSQWSINGNRHDEQ